MVFKYLVAFLALANGARIGEDSRTWSPRLTCERCLSVVNNTETILKYQACRNLPSDETTICRDIVFLAVEKFSPGIVCRELGYFE